MLTGKQEKYVQELIKGKSQREAYRAAYPSSEKWKDNVVDSKACVLFKNEKIVERYNELQKKIENKVVYDAAKVRQKIIDAEMAILDADYGNLFEIKAKGRSGLASVPKKNIQGIDMRTVKSYRYDKSGKLIVEFYDKQQAVDVLMSLFGIAIEEQHKEEITVNLKGLEQYAE